jgi:hypothetical protein
MSVVAVIFITLGYYFNLLVMTANDGKMPVANISFAQAHDRWSVLTQNTNFPYLSDVLPYQFSIGDLLMIVGFILAVYVGIKWLIRRTV